MNVVRGEHVYENAKVESLSGFEESVNPAQAVFIEFKKSLPVLATMADVQGLARKTVTIYKRHRETTPWLLS